MAAVGLQDRALIRVRQVHGVGLRHADLDAGVPRADPPFADGDALVGAEPGHALSVRVADCAPVLLADPRASLVAAVHAGWRGVAQGIGMALMEEFTPGRGENLHDYLIPTIGDVPPIESILVERASSAGPFGAKGIGEQALIPTAPAILNAIHHATGARITRIPATPDRVLAALRKPAP